MLLPGHSELTWALELYGKIWIPKKVSVDPETTSGWYALQSKDWPTLSHVTSYVRQARTLEPILFALFNSVVLVLHPVLHVCVIHSCQKVGLFHIVFLFCCYLLFCLKIIQLSICVYATNMVALLLPI